MNHRQTHCPCLVIGLTGVPSAGKGEVAAIVRRWAEARGWRMGHLSFSDQIKEEARSRGLPESGDSRELLGRIVTEMRAAEGPAVLAKRILAKLRSVPQEERAEVYVVEAIRHVQEIEVLREELGERLAVLAVVAELTTIAERLLARARPDESREAMRGKENAIEMIRKELAGQSTAAGINVSACIERADVHIHNDGTLDDLARSVAVALDRYL